MFDSVQDGADYVDRSMTLEPIIISSQQDLDVFIQQVVEAIAASNGRRNA